MIFGFQKRSVELLKQSYELVQKMKPYYQCKKKKESNVNSCSRRFSLVVKRVEGSAINEKGVSDNDHT
jgi:hypothetical protein